MHMMYAELSGLKHPTIKSLQTWTKYVYFLFIFYWKILKKVTPATFMPILKYSVIV